MPNKHAKNLLAVKSLVDAHAPDQRVELYRWLASVADDAWLRDQLFKMANTLESYDELNKGVGFKFSGSAQQSGDGNGDGDGHHKQGDGK